MREHEVLAGLRSGLSNKEIADNPSLSEVTVKHYTKSLLGKSGARNRVHTVCQANELDIRHARRACRQLFGWRRDSRMSGQSAVLPVIYQIGNNTRIG